MTEDVLTAAATALASGESAAMLTIVRTEGSTPQRVGAKMLVFADGRTVGTIGGGCYENDACLRARQILEHGKPALLHYQLSDDLAEETGLICGGQMDVFIERLEGAPRLYIVGAGHVGYYLARVANEVGFQVHVVDDRVKFANRERFPSAASVTVDDLPSWLHSQPIPSSAYVVIVTRGHRHDLEALRALAARDLRYLGLIGSRAKVARLYQALVAESLPPECLRRVHAPVGLDIGAITPQEIAVAIVAELIAVKYGRLNEDSTTIPSLKWQPRLVNAD
jgi:xanthine dehydrogenase accessory factor